MSGASLELKVNGESRTVPEGTTVQSLLALLKIDRGQVAVEVNAEVVRRASHAERLLRSGDQVEIVTFVGGG